MIGKILEKLRFTNKQYEDAKVQIVSRLLKESHITAEEAATLLQAFNLTIRADKFEMSSGAKMVGGCDFESTDWGRR